MGYPIYHSQYTAAQIEASIGKTPRIKAATRTWEIWDISTSAYVDTGVSIDTELFVDSTLTEAGYAADAKVTGDKLGELKSALTEIGVPFSTPANYPVENYADVLTGPSVVADAKITAGSYISSVNVYSNANFGSGVLYLVDDDNKCVKTWSVTGISGWNKIDIGYTPAANVRLGLYNIPVKYKNGSSVGSDYVYSASGLNSVAPLIPTVGETVTISKLYSGKFALSLNWKIASSYIKQIEVNKEDISELQESVLQLTESTSAPTLYSAISDYPNAYSNASALSDIVISSGSYIESASFISSGTANGYIFLIRTSDNTCVFSKQIKSAPGLNTVVVGYAVNSDVRFGFYGLGVCYKNSSVDAAHKYSSGVDRTSPHIPSVGDTVTISHYYSGNFAMSIQWKTTSELNGRIGNAELNIAEIKRGTIYDHPCIVSFVDDDTGKYVPEIWGEILDEAPIRMGFACVTGFMAGLETPPTIYEQMTLSELQGLYNNGHEVYSHSYSHPDFASNSTTVSDIETQCRLSKQWLDSNGFTRNSDIIVYPGGMGESKTDKQAVVRQFYRYGIDTVGGGINPEPIKNPWCIYRYNADTATLAQLKDKVDDAIATGKLLVFMNHAYQLNLDKENQVAKMIAIIEYIQAQGALIMPFGEAMHRIYGWN